MRPFVLEQRMRRIALPKQECHVNRNSAYHRIAAASLGCMILGWTSGCGATRMAARSEQAPASVAATTVEEPEIQGVAHFEAEIPADAAPVATPAEGWTLARFESVALTHNPAIQQASASAHKAMGYRDQVSKKPNPTLGYNGSQLADRSTDQHIAFMEQDFVTADKLSKNRRVLDQEVQSQLWEVESQRQRVLTDVRIAFYRTLAAQRQLELTSEFTELARKGVATAEARFAAGQVAKTEILQLEIQRQQIMIQRQQAEATLRASWKQLISIAGMPELTPQPLVGTLPTEAPERDWDQIASEILAASPELEAARARLCRAQANIDRQEAQSTPNLQFMIAAGRDNGVHSNMINTQVGMPIPFHNANEGNISAAQAEYCRASQELRRLELSVQSRLAAARGDYESAAAAVTRSRDEILPRAAESVVLVDQAYEAGEFDFLQVLVARRTFFDSNLEFVKSQTALAVASSLVDGLVLSGGLDATRDTEFDSGLRDQALSGQ